jgi:serine/threonine-protein kinase RsbW
MGPFAERGLPAGRGLPKSPADRVSFLSRTLTAELPNLCLSLSNRPENVALVREVLAGLGEAVQLDEDSLYDIKAAVTEACNNVVLHAYEGKEGPLGVELYAPASGIEVVVRDRGRGIPPGFRSGDESGPGIGLRMIRALVRKVEFNGGAAPEVSEESEGQQPDDRERGQGTEVRMSFEAAGTRPLEPCRDDGFELPATGAGELASTVAMTLAPARLADVVLPRLLCLLAARAEFSSDRISDAQRIAHVLAGYVRDSSNGGQLSVGVTVQPRDLALRIEPLRSVSEKELAAEPGVDGERPEAAGLTKVEPAPNPDTLVLRLADRP